MRYNVKNFFILKKRIKEYDLIPRWYSLISNSDYEHHRASGEITLQINIVANVPKFRNRLECFLTLEFFKYITETLRFIGNSYFERDTITILI